MKREFLLGLGLESDVVNQVMAVHGSEINTLTDKLNGLEATNKQLEEQINQRDTQLEELKNNNADDLKKRIDELQADNAKLKEQHASELQENARQHKIEMLASSLSDKEDVREFAKFKLQDLQMENGELVGSEDAINQLKEANPSLFVTQGEKPKWSQGKVSTVGETVMSKEDILNIKDKTERQKMIAQHANLFN